MSKGKKMSDAERDAKYDALSEAIADAERAILALPLTEALRNAWQNGLDATRLASLERDHKAALKPLKARLARLKGAQRRL